MGIDLTRPKSRQSFRLLRSLRNAHACKRLFGGLLRAVTAALCLSAAGSGGPCALHLRPHLHSCQSVSGRLTEANAAVLYRLHVCPQKTTTAPCVGPPALQVCDWRERVRARSMWRTV